MCEVLTENKFVKHVVLQRLKALLFSKKYYNNSRPFVVGKAFFNFLKRNKND